ncbi:integrase, partial [Flavimaricola sp.]|nr:integrase [Flavimaricola sp.]
RNTGCPEALSKEILGHAQGSIAANYGAGYAIDVMRAALEKAWQ